MSIDLAILAINRHFCNFRQIRHSRQNRHFPKGPFSISFECLFTIGHFTVMDGSEAEGDLVLIQTFLLYYVNQVILMLTSIFQEKFP